MELSKRISLYRKQLGMTQKNLADAIGAKQSHISRLERGDYMPSHDTLRHLAKALNVTVSDLMGENDIKPTHEMTEAIEIARMILGQEHQNEGSVDALKRLLASPLLKSQAGLATLNNLMDMLDKESL